jgi:hypothetical protein
VLDVSLRHKSSLKRGNNLWEEKLQSVCQNLENNFIGNVTKANRPELMSCVGAIKLRN